MTKYSRITCIQR